MDTQEIGITNKVLLMEEHFFEEFRLPGGAIDLMSAWKKFNELQMNNVGVPDEAQEKVRILQISTAETYFQIISALYPRGVISRQAAAVAVASATLLSSIPYLLRLQQQEMQKMGEEGS